jgi:hypothetical protein
MGEVGVPSPLRVHRGLGPGFGPIPNPFREVLGTPHLISTVRSGLEIARTVSSARRCGVLEGPQAGQAVLPLLEAILERLKDKPEAEEVGQYL